MLATTAPTASPIRRLTDAYFQWELKNPWMKESSNGVSVRCGVWLEDPSAAELLQDPDRRHALDRKRSCGDFDRALS
jgi:hypothetical protein